MTTATAHPRPRVAAYLLHLRPAEWPVVGVHMLLGWWLAAGPHWPDQSAWVGVVAWVVLLNGGTLALNSAFDRDTGDIAFLRDPPRAPAHLAAFAIALMAAGLALTWHYPPRFRIVYMACMAMSIAYSVPPLRLKAIAGLDLVINMIGFGTLTPFAGWALTGRVAHGAMLVVLCAFSALFAALYPLTQLYQVDEDRARGDRTLALRLGARGSLSFAVFAAGVAFGMLAMAGWRTGWGWHDMLRWGALAIAALAWMAVLVPWFAHARDWSSRQHQGAMYHALVAWALTDVAVFLAWVL